MKNFKMKRAMLTGLFFITLFLVVITGMTETIPQPLEPRIPLWKQQQLQKQQAQEWQRQQINKKRKNISPKER
jgi:hypothetical protein